MLTVRLLSHLLPRGAPSAADAFVPWTFAHDVATLPFRHCVLQRGEHRIKNHFLGQESHKQLKKLVNQSWTAPPPPPNGVGPILNQDLDSLLMAEAKPQFFHKKLNLILKKFLRQRHRKSTLIFWILLSLYVCRPRAQFNPLLPQADVSFPFLQSDTSGQENLLWIPIILRRKVLFYRLSLESHEHSCHQRIHCDKPCVHILDIFCTLAAFTWQVEQPAAEMMK